MAAQPQKAQGAIDSTFAFGEIIPFAAALALGLSALGRSTPTRPRGADRSENTMVDSCRLGTF
jgi:hypothetical protein